jgi:hypothetical protein
MAAGTAVALKSEIDYAADLIGAGVEGIVSAWKASGDRGFASPRKPAIMASTVAGAALGVLGAWLGGRRRTIGYRAAMCGLAGTALGLGVGMAWESRDFTRGATRGAMRKVNAVRDARWLAANPIAYA